MMIWNHRRLDSQTCHSSLRDPVSSNFFLASRFELSRGGEAYALALSLQEVNSLKEKLGKVKFQQGLS